jgi:hypothetical protein
MECYNTGQPGCQGDVRRTVAGRACCWPCGTRLLAEAREGLTVRDYGDEHRPYRGAVPRETATDAERLAAQAETIANLARDLARVTEERDAARSDRNTALTRVVYLEAERDRLARVYRDLADRLARAEGRTYTDARREVAGAVRDEDRRVGAALARVLASISRVTVQTDTGGYVTGGWQGEGAAAVWHYGDAATPAEALERLAEQLEQS